MIYRAEFKRYPDGQESLKIQQRIENGTMEICSVGTAILMAEDLPKKALGRYRDARGLCTVNRPVSFWYHDYK